MNKTTDQMLVEEMKKIISSDPLLINAHFHCIDVMTTMLRLINIRLMLRGYPVPCARFSLNVFDATVQPKEEMLKKPTCDGSTILQ